MSEDEAVGASACPCCGAPPAMAFAEQAFCSNDDCSWVTWNPTKTMAELLADVHTIDLGGLA